MNDNGYTQYRQFQTTPPWLVAEWHDTQTDAVGWLAMNSLRNGAACGGTRMHPGGSKEEAVFLAKTMELKSQISGPPVGGAKAVINFDPEDPRKKEVLRRFYASVGPYLLHCCGTGGDLSIDEVKDVIPITEQLLGLKHPYAGVVRGHFKHTGKQADQICNQLRQGVEIPVPLADLPTESFNIADLTTGYGVVRSLHHLYQLRGKSLAGQRVLIEGFGVVGAAAAYYLTKEGAKVVGVLSKASSAGDAYRWAVDDNGLNIHALWCERDGLKLSATCHSGENPDAFWQTKADIFIPAAVSHTVTLARIEQLSAIGVRVMASGANNPFADMTFDATAVQQKADQTLTVVPDFISNCGMARVLAYLMQQGARLEADAILQDLDQTVQQAMQNLLSGYDHPTGLLNQAYSLYVPA
ncbi:MAG: Glu/Leu/Phe/Val dehydrogenase dimerization domain-containing protein [Pseudomonadota bacterium]